MENTIFFFKAKEMTKNRSHLVNGCSTLHSRTKKVNTWYEVNAGILYLEVIKCSTCGYKCLCYYAILGV